MRHADGRPGQGPGALGYAPPVPLLDVDAVVVGAGAMGAAAAWHLGGGVAGSCCSSSSIRPTIGAAPTAPAGSSASPTAIPATSGWRRGRCRCGAELEADAGDDAARADRAARPRRAGARWRRSRRTCGRRGAAAERLTPAAAQRAVPGHEVRGRGRLQSRRRPLPGGRHGRRPPAPSRGARSRAPRRTVVERIEAGPGGDEVRAPPSTARPDRGGHLRSSWPPVPGRRGCWAGSSTASRRCRSRSSSRRTSGPCSPMWAGPASCTTLRGGVPATPSASAPTACSAPGRA